MGNSFFIRQFLFSPFKTCSIFCNVPIRLLNINKCVCATDLQETVSQLKKKQRKTRSIDSANSRNLHGVFGVWTMSRVPQPTQHWPVLIRKACRSPGRPCGTPRSPATAPTPGERQQLCYYQFNISRFGFCWILKGWFMFIASVNMKYTFKIYERLTQADLRKPLISSASLLKLSLSALDRERLPVRRSLISSMADRWQLAARRQINVLFI